MSKFFKVDLANDGWGLLVNEGSAQEPKFRLLFKGSSERWMEQMAANLNNENPEAMKTLEPSLAKASEGRRHD